MLLVFPQPLDWASLLAIPGVRCCWRVNGAWVALLFGIVTTRFRDLDADHPERRAADVLPDADRLDLRGPAQQPEPGRSPSGPGWPSSTRFLHFIEIIRRPMLGQEQHLRHWVVVLVITVVGWALTLVVAAPLPVPRLVLGVSVSERTTPLVSITTEGRLRRLPDLRRQEPVAEEDRHRAGRRQHRHRRRKVPIIEALRDITLDARARRPGRPGRAQRRRQVHAAAAAVRHLRADPRRRRDPRPGGAGLRPRRRHGPGDLRPREHHDPRASSSA